MPISRRKLLELVSSSTFFLAVAPLAAEPITLAPDSPPLSFPQGVASADPQMHSVMLWTRALPEQESSAPQHLLLEVSTDENFSQLLLQSRLQAESAGDYTVRAYVEGLEPDTHYYYRFVAGGGTVSRTGRTRTAPAPDATSKVNLAFASCQSYEQGYYGSWARMLEDDSNAAPDEQIHFVLHLGDFIYERCWKQRLDGSAQSRSVPPFPQGVDTHKNRYAVSLDDYRHLYKTYLSDPHLQAARARWPFVCTWDDHEFANDNFQSYSTYGGTPKLEAQRKLWANQAWFEYIPAVLDQLQKQPAHGFRNHELVGDAERDNRAGLKSLRIYRKLNWGKYVDIVLTDARSYRSAPCVSEELNSTLDLPLSPVELVAIADAGITYADGNPPATLPFGDDSVPNPARERLPGSLLGLKQRAWFLDTVTESTARWKLWANALPLLPLRLDMSSLPFADYADSIFNIDSWAGFPYEVSFLMRHLQEQKVTGVVSLSGDHHMHAAGSIRHSTTDAAAVPVMVDFTVAGISSEPIFEDLLAAARREHPDFGALVYRTTAAGAIEPVWNMSMLHGVLAAFTYSKTGLNTLANWMGPNEANPGLNYVDTAANGYGLASFDADAMQVRMVTMEDLRTDFTTAPAIKRVTSFQLPHWEAGEEPQLQGPVFEKGAPFPFVVPAV